MIQIRCAVICMTALVSLGAAPAVEPVAYTLAPQLHDGAITGLVVTVRFRADASGRTRLGWAPQWAGETHLDQWSRDLTITGASAVEREGAVRTIRSAPGAALTARYRIVSAFAADPTVDDSDQPKPVVRPTWFLGMGEALFAHPVDHADAPATFAWEGPPGIGFASDLEHAAARPGERGKTVGDILESAVIGGRDLRVTATQAGGAPLRVASIGRYTFDTPVFERLASAVIASERDFWRAKDHQPFLVLLSPVAARPGRQSYSGTGRGDAFAIWMDQGAPVDGLAWLLAHEYFHTWNPARLGGAVSEEDAAAGYWFSEGFTDFYARQLMVRAGLMSPAAFAHSWNEAFAGYANSPYRTTPNRIASPLFWREPAAQTLPYQRGALLAALVNAELRIKGRSLDVVLRDQERAARRELKTAAPDLFVATARRQGFDVAPILARHLDAGAPLLLPVDAFGPCARVLTENVPKFERGWDGEATTKAGDVITGLDPASPAYAAGLRNGMRILKRLGGEPDQALTPYRLQVDDRGVTREIGFTPAGKTRVMQQRLVLDDAAFRARPEACRAALAR